MEKISESQVKDALKSLPGWGLQDEKITRQYRFKTFGQSISFVNMVAVLAEKQDHHPDIDIRYDRVTLGLWSHDAGGITPRDLRFATALDLLQDGKPLQAT
jgi:4a-hydroxytetrahydrobiopterin dehydratase